VGPTTAGPPPLPASKRNLPAAGAAAQAASDGSSLRAHSPQVAVPPGTSNVSATRPPAVGSSAPPPHVVAPPSGPAVIAPTPPLALATSGSGAGPEAVAAIAVRTHKNLSIHCALAVLMVMSVPLIPQVGHTGHKSQVGHTGHKSQACTWLGRTLGWAAYIRHDWSAVEYRAGLWVYP
jgi:hypothetical protein